MTELAAARMDGELKRLLGSVLADRYRIDAVLGVGGMGAVFRAHHLLLRRDVAIKVLHPKLSRHSQIRRRFDREAQSSARLAHPNIVRVTEFGSLADDTKYLVMELLEGYELHTLLGKPLAPRRATELILQIILALEHAHAKGVVHRDLKPENIFVTRNHDGDEVLKLVDFGVAKMFDADHEQDGQKALTRMGLVFGTPKYMSPEQAMGLPVDARTDLYAAGAILYEMLAGRPPLTHDDPVALVRMQVSVDPAPLDEKIPLELRKIVAGLLAKDRNDRYFEAHQVRIELEEVLCQLQLSDGAGAALTQEAQQAWFAASQSGIRSVEPAANLSTTIAGNISESAWNPTEEQSYRIRAPILRRLSWGWILGLLVVGAVVGANFFSMLGGSNKGENFGGAIEQIEDKVQVAKGLPEKNGHDLNFSAIDRLILSKNRKDALAMIHERKKHFPSNPGLLWREGKAFALSKKYRNRAIALDRYSMALKADRELLKDLEFFSELSKLLNIVQLRETAIELAINDLDNYGHTFLLRLVNDPEPKNELQYEDRHKILDHLQKSPDADLLIDKRFNLIRDLHQARLTKLPCTALHTALKEINLSKDPEFLEELRRVNIRTFLEEMNVSHEERASCEALPQVIRVLVELFENLQESEGDETGWAESVESDSRAQGSIKSESEIPNLISPFDRAPAGQLDLESELGSSPILTGLEKKRGAKTKRRTKNRSRNRMTSSKRRKEHKGKKVVANSKRQ